MKVNNQKHLRILVSIYAYDYEIANCNLELCTDLNFDWFCRQVNLDSKTDRPDLDKWFIENFNPSTGQWIHKHPELDQIALIHKGFEMYQCRHDRLK